MHIKQRSSQWVSFVRIKVLEGVNSNQIFDQVNWWILILYEDNKYQIHHPQTSRKGL